MDRVKKVRKKLVDVVAVQWTRDDPMSLLINFTNHLVQLDDVDEVFRVYNRLTNQWVPFEYGDWIVKGEQDEFYPVTPAAFKKSFEETTATVVEETKTEGKR